MNYRAAWNLASIPDDIFKSEWARRNSAKRKTRSGGPKIKDNSAEAVKRREQRREQRQRRAEGKGK